uniref:Flocculation protein FLO11-like n=1 Tax=Drosophila rhopaloa TaxID=1041015 RepID=A0A6P4ETL6_DRORH
NNITSETPTAITTPCNTEPPSKSTNSGNSASSEDPSADSTTPDSSTQGNIDSSSTQEPSTETTTKYQEEKTDCSNLPNGVFIRNRLSCNKYYVCLNGKPIPGNCPRDLNFDIKRKVCNFPSLVDCSSEEVLESVTKKPPITEFTPDCKSEPNGAYIRDPSSCSGFFVCANGRPISRQCPRGLHFDIKSNFCNYPSLVQCSVEESQLSIHKALVAEEIPDCSKVKEDTRFGDVKQHNKYYVCLKGKATLHYCSPGNWFDIRSQSCVDQRLANVKTTVPNPEVSTRIPENTTEKNGDSGNSGLENDISTEQYLQSTTEKSISSSQNPLTTEPTSESTTPRTTISSTQSFTKNPETSTTLKDSELTTEKDDEPGSNGSESGISTKPSPQSSTEGDISSSENPLTTEPTSLPHSSTENTFSSKNPLTTEPPSRSTNSEGSASSENPFTDSTTSASVPTPDGSTQGNVDSSSTLEPSTETTTNLDQEELPDCSNLPNGVYIRNRLSCNKYYVCLNGKPIPGNCPRNLNFDIKRKVCNFPSLVDCSFEEVLDSVTKKPPNTEFTPDCKSVPNGGYIRDPTSCSGFFVCANGRPISRQCPRGLHFDNKSNSCNYPSLAQCSVEEAKSSIHVALLAEGVPDCSKVKEDTRFGDVKQHNKYYVCLKGKAILHYCSPGNWFDIRSQSCVDQRLVKVK